MRYYSELFNKTKKAHQTYRKPGIALLDIEKAAGKAAVHENTVE